MRIPWGDPPAPLNPSPPSAAVPAIPAVPAGRGALTQPRIAKTARTASSPTPPHRTRGALTQGIPEPRPRLPPGRLLLALADRGITVTLEGEQIRLRPTAAVTPGVLAEVRAQQPALVALLRCVGTVSGPRVMTPKGPACCAGAAGTVGLACCSIAIR